MMLVKKTIQGTRCLTHKAISLKKKIQVSSIRQASKTSTPQAISEH